MMVAHNKLAERPELSRLSLHFSLSDCHTTVIELDDGKIYRKPLYLMVKTHGFQFRFSQLNQSTHLLALRQRSGHGHPARDGGCRGVRNAWRLKGMPWS
jgi:hypothetical protein